MYRLHHLCLYIYIYVCVWVRNVHLHISICIHDVSCHEVTEPPQTYQKRRQKAFGSTGNNICTPCVLVFLNLNHQLVHMFHA